MKYSINYNLNKPDYVDQYDLRHWNENTDIIDNQMKSEETSRIQSDATLQQNIESEASARQGADTTLQGNINNEVNARTNADTQIRNDISDGTIVAKKAQQAQQAQQDEDGSVIKDTYQKKSNKVTSWSSPTSDNNYPSEKLVKDSLNETVSSMKLTKIWENSTPNQQFALQTIQIQDLSSYEAIIIEWLLSRNGTGILSSFLKLERNGAVTSGRVGLPMTYSGIQITSSISRLATFNRLLTWDPAFPNQLEFNDCFNFEVRTDGTITAIGVTNEWFIPYRIYGIKDLLN